MRSNALLLFVLCCSTVLLAACSGLPSPRVGTQPGDDPAASGPDYLRAVKTVYSTPISDLGDVDLLGPDSAMTESLVGGSADLLVAATVFEEEDVFTLDLIVLNQGAEAVHVTRGDLFVVDAGGLWLSPLEDWDRGRGYGLRARQASSASDIVDHLPYYEVDQGSPALAYAGAEQFDFRSLGEKRTAVSTERVGKPVRVDQDFVYRSGNSIESVPTPTSVVVPAESGRAFWGYFSGKDPSFPLTAVVLVGGEQLLFRFDR